MGGPTWAVVAYYTLGGGIITALIAAIPGFIDYLSLTDPKSKRTGRNHMILNLIAVVIFIVDFAMRRGRAEFTITPFVFSLVGVGLIAISGWLGGELVHVQHVSIEEKEVEGVAETKSYPGQKLKKSTA